MDQTARHPLGRIGLRPGVAKASGAHDPTVRSYLIAGYAAVFFLVFFLGGWAALANLAGAVIAGGQVVVESSIKKVQHPTGGVVGEIRVRNGQRVESGEIVLRLDETVTRANLGVVTAQLSQFVARLARLQAERDEREEILFPADFLNRFPDGAEAIATEQKLFASRRETRARQKEQLRERIEQIRIQIDATGKQVEGRQKEIELIEKELADLRNLFSRKLVPLTRIMPLEREGARLTGDYGNLIAQQARLKAQIAETELQIIGVDQEARAEVLRDLRETEARVAEFSERRTAAEDQLRRIDIRAPATGVVHDLAVHTVGGVIGNGEVLMSIVPENEKLAIDVRISPNDIDQVVIGQPTTIRFPAFNQRTTPEARGHISRVAADATHEPQTGISYYLARVAVAEEDLALLSRTNLKLVPGMPVETFIQTGERTVLSYLVKPLTDNFRRAMRED